MSIMGESAAKIPRQGEADMIEKTTRKTIRNSLLLRVPELAGSSAFLLYLAEAGTERLTLVQAAFFMLAAAADARGVPMTLSQIKEAYGDQLNKSIHNSYKVLLEPSRVYPEALGWLERIENPDDEREKFLKLTDKGRAVVTAALNAIQPME